MTSSNISNLLVQQMVPVQDDIKASQSLELGKSENSFDKTLKEFTNSSKAMDDVKTTDVKKEDTPESVKIEDKTSIKEKIVRNNDDSSDSDLEDEAVLETIQSFLNEIATVITEELDISPEELEDAMEVLDLSLVDLLDTSNIGQVVLEVTSESDSVSLLMSDEFNTILDETNKIVNELMSEIREPIEFIQAEFGKDEVTNQMTTDILIDEQVEVVVDEDVQNVEKEPAIQMVSTLDEKPLKEEVKVQNFEQPEVDEEENVETTPKNVVETNLSQDTQDKSNESFESSTQNNREVNFDRHRVNARHEDSLVSFEQPRELTFSVKDEVVIMPEGQRVDVQDMIDQIVTEAKLMNTTESTTMEMTLNPEGLGKIFMEVTQKGDEITAKIFTENEVVKEALESQMASLRTQLNDTTNKITSIEVAVGAHEFERNLEEDSRNQQNSSEQQNQNKSRHHRIDLNNLDDLRGLMSEEEQLVAQIMRENGNTLDYHA